MKELDFPYLSAMGLAELIRARAVSPVEVTDALLRRIERINGQLNAYCTIDESQVRAKARDSEAALMRGEIRGPLHGVPFSVKDMIFTAGQRTTGGCKIFSDFVPEEDAATVARLKNAGAICIGKTNTATLGYSGVCDNLVFGATKNPWNLALTPGGSSGGAAAAVAAGLGPLALGTDVGGSVRVPSSFCGIFGLKPSFGLLPRYPGFFGEWETMVHVGPITRTVRDAALILDVMKGPDDRDRWSLPDSNINFLEELNYAPGKTLKAGWSPTLGYVPVEPEVASLTKARVRLLADVGLDVDEINPGFENPHDDFSTMIAIQTAGALSKFLSTSRDQFDPDLLKVIEKGVQISGVQYAQAEHRKFNLYGNMANFFKRFDVLITPTVPICPFPIEYGPGPEDINGQKVEKLYGWYPFTFPFGLTGLPAASIPCGWSNQGVPVGLQIVGRRHDDLTVLRVAALMEEAWPWTDRMPPLD